MKLLIENWRKFIKEAATLGHQTKAAQREYLDSLPEDKRQAYEEYKDLSLKEPDSMEEAEPINQRMAALEPIVKPIKRELAAIGKDFASKRKPDPDRTHGGWKGTQGGGIKGTEAGPDDYGQQYE